MSRGRELRDIIDFEPQHLARGNQLQLDLERRSRLQHLCMTSVSASEFKCSLSEASEICEDKSSLVGKARVLGSERLHHKEHDNGDCSSQASTTQC